MRLHLGLQVRSALFKKKKTGQCFIPTYWPLQPVHPTFESASKASPTGRSFYMTPTQPSVTGLRCEIPQKLTIPCHCPISYGGFLKWWYPTTMGFPTKNDHFGVFWGYHHLRKHLYIITGNFLRLKTIEASSFIQPLMLLLLTLSLQFRRIFQRGPRMLCLFLLLGSLIVAPNLVSRNVKRGPPFYSTASLSLVLCLFEC